jgi:hypothetical protein
LWEVGPGEYWWESAVTYGRSNVLHAKGGGCGTIAAIVTLLITDNCGGTTGTGYSLRMTDGEWGDWTDMCGNGVGCASGICCDPGAADYSDYKYRAGDWQDGAGTCSITCCSEAVAYVSSTGCWFECDDNDNCLRKAPGSSVEIKSIKANSAEWICP